MWISASGSFKPGGKNEEEECIKAVLLVCLSLSRARDTPAAALHAQGYYLEFLQAPCVFSKCIHPISAKYHGTYIYNTPKLHLKINGYYYL